MFKIGDKVKLNEAYFGDHPHEKIYADMVFEVVAEDPSYGVTADTVKAFFGVDAHLVFAKDYHPEDGDGFAVVYEREVELANV